MDPTRLGADAGLLPSSVPGQKMWKGGRVRALGLSSSRQLLELVGECYGLTDIDEFRGSLLGVLRRVVPADYASYNEVGPGPYDTWSLTEPAMAAEAHETWSRLAHEHPVISHVAQTGDGRPLRISDVLDRPAFHALDLYREFYRPVGVEWQVAFTLPVRSPVMLGIALSRTGSDFSDEECLLLAHARPHLIQAWRNAQLLAAREHILAAVEGGLRRHGEFVAAVGRDGRLDHASDDAIALLRAHGALTGGDVARLQGPVARLVELGTTAGHPPEPLVLGAAGDALVVRLLPGRPGDPVMLLLDRGDAGMTAEGLRSLGLTARQAEALRWIALGRTVPDAARLMGISASTTAKHLEQTYRKLGVRTRSQAAATAWAATGVPGSN
jgi:DNA-binding CsgD family transcriptional regulator